MSIYGSAGASFGDPNHEHVSALVIGSAFWRLRFSYNDVIGSTKREPRQVIGYALVLVGPTWRKGKQTTAS